MWARHSGCDSPEYDLNDNDNDADDAGSLALSFDGGDDIGGGFEVLNLEDNAVDAAAAAVDAAAAAVAAAAAGGGDADGMQEQQDEQL
jgi:hypothetical protein